MDFFGMILLVVGLFAIGLLALADPVLLSRITEDRDKELFLHRDSGSRGPR